jgi:hypothetical protein
MTDTALPPPPPPAVELPTGLLLSYNGHTWTEDDMTTGHAMVVESLIGERMEAIVPTASITALAAWLTVLESSTTGRDVEDIAGEVASLPLASLLACIVQV